VHACELHFISENSHPNAPTAGKQIRAVIMPLLLRNVVSVLSFGKGETYLPDCTGTIAAMRNQ
jgi:hypothetical protein